MKPMTIHAWIALLLAILVPWGATAGSPVTGTFVGDGNGLTNLNASALASGTVPAGRLAGKYNNVLKFNNSANVFYGSLNGLFTGDAVIPGRVTLKQGVGGATLWDIKLGNVTNSVGAVATNCLLFSTGGAFTMALTTDGKLVNIGDIVAGFPGAEAILHGDGHISADTDIDAAFAITAGTSITAGVNITAGGDITAGSDITAGRDFFDGRNITAGNDLTVGRHIIAGGNLSLNGGITAGGNISTPGQICGQTCVQISDRNAKEKFAPVDGREVLERVVGLPISRWNFKTDANTQHIGPMAQDFYAAFQVGQDDKHIATVDENGVALAAIQGLYQELTAEKTRNAALEKRLAALEAKLQQVSRQLDVSATVPDNPQAFLGVTGTPAP